MPRDRARKAGRTVRRQAKGTYDNGRSLLSRTRLDTVLPNGVRSLISEVLTVGAYTAGRGSAYQQVWSSITWIILAVIASPFTLGYSLLLAVPGAIGLLVGLVRLVPAANNRFQDARGDKLRNRDVPLWKRD